MGDGVQWTRSGSVGAGSVTLRTVLTGGAGEAAGGATSDVYTFNAHGLVDSESLGLDAGSGDPATTTYAYQTASGRYDNGVPKWSKVTLVTHPDGSWVGYQYQDPTAGPTTGWVTGAVTPFQSSAWTPGGGTSTDRLESYAYDPSLSGNGQAPDPTMLVQPPRTVTDYVLGTQTSETFNDYRGDQIITRQALTSSGATWATAGLFSTTTIQAFDASSTTSVTGNLSENKSGYGAITYTSTSSWFNDTLSQSTSTTDPFGDATSSTDESLGSAYQGDTAAGEDSFGRPLTQSLAGGQSTTNNYTNDDGTPSWFGPASVVEADGSTTKYAYTPLGQVASRTTFAGTGYSVKASYVYDAAGHVVSQTTQAVDASGNPKPSDPTGDPTTVTDTSAYDAQGRLTQQVTNAGGNDPTANQTTATVYSPFDGTDNVATTTNPDGSTTVARTFLDGSTDRDAGTGQTPDAATEGVVASDTTDANGNLETAGSTWVLSTSDGGQSWAKAFTNVLGEQYLVQQSDPGSSAAPGAGQSYGDALTLFNLNGQAFEQVGADGTKQFTIYDPMTGQAGASWTDVAGTGAFVAGVDPRTVTHPAALAGSAAAHAGGDSDQLSTTGSQDDNSQAWNGGLDSSSTVDGQTTTTVQSLPTGPGAYTVTTTNPDGTQDVQTFAAGLLMQDQQLGADASVVATTTYTYDAMRRLSSQADNTGTQTFGYYADGTQKSAKDPGHSGSTTDNVPDPQANTPQTITRADGTAQTQVTDAQGNLVSQSGAGVLQAAFGYDTANTGNLTSLTTYGTVTGTTNWNYDPNTGQLQFKQYADGTRDTYTYNDKGQLASLVEPGVTGTFGYDAAGDPLSASYFDSTTGIVQSFVAQQDDQGRAIATVNTDNNKTFTTTDSYTPQGDLKTETFGSAGNAVVGYGYYSTSGFGSTGSPDGLQTLTVNAPSGQTATQGYTYESGGKRLKTITVNGITITYVYLPNSDQLQSMTVGGVTTTFIPDSSDGARLGSMSVAAGGQTVYDASYGYNQLDQRTSDTVTSTAVDDSGNTSSVDASRGYTYDTSKADALVSVQDGSGSTIETYGFDGAGNLVNFNGNVQSANNVNQLTGYTFNGRGDATVTANYTIQWDALNRPMQIAPKNAVVGGYEITLGYDSQNRWLWKDVYQWDGSQYVYAYSRKAVWSGGQLVAELDQSGAMVKQYTWGPNGLALITDYSSGTARSYVPIRDASGNTAMVIDALTGAVVASYTYDAFGNVLSASGPMKDICPFLGKGLYVHAEVPGLMFAQNRVTDGRIWLSRDQTGESGGLGLYGLDGGDPINLSDASGDWPSPTTLDTPPPSTGPDSGEMLQRALAARRGVSPPAPAAAAAPASGGLFSWISATASEWWTQQSGGFQAVANWALIGQIGDDAALFGPARDKFDQVVFDRTHGVEDAAMARLSPIGHKIDDSIVVTDSIGGFTFDPQERANAAGTGGRIMDLTSLAVSTVAGGQAIFAVIRAGGLGAVITGALTNGQTITGLIVNGQAVALTTGALVNAGISAEAANHLVQAMSAQPGSQSAKTFRDLLTPSEQTEFEALRAKYADWMPADGLDTPATVRTVEENAAARAAFSGRGHHPTPLKFGGEPNPNDLMPTGETRTLKNPTHTEITNFWNKVLRRLTAGVSQ